MARIQRHLQLPALYGACLVGEEDKLVRQG